jgi:D-sedoheptulose 7-phosphate isomerase
MLDDRKIRLGQALSLLRARADDIGATATLIIATLRSGGRILAAGNGGSAAEAQHFVTELVGRFQRERDAYAAIALTADTAILTAVANDYGFEEVFARQVAAYGHPGDVFVAFSTSGESENLVRAAAMARERGLTSVAVTGRQPSRLATLADLTIQVPVVETPLVQELHAVTVHVLCDLIESSLAGGIECDGP